MIKEISFMFDIDAEVKTPFGDEGIVTMLGVDEGGNTYFVKTATTSNWYKEAELQNR